MDLFRDMEFVFNTEHIFPDRYQEQEDYFRLCNRYAREGDNVMTWETNFIADLRTANIDQRERKGFGVRITPLEMAGNVLIGHLSEWPVGRYHKAHAHAGGAVLVGVRSLGYELMWPPETGSRPYENGFAHLVVKVDWKEGSVFSPSTGWFHQPFNTGRESARHFAVRYGSYKYNVGFQDAHRKEGVLVSTGEGGMMIEYEDEDPEITRQYNEALQHEGVSSQMPFLIT